MPQLLPLPMTPETLLTQVIHKALAGKYRSDEVTVLLIAIALQESGLRSRWQIVDPKQPEKRGPAHGLWQFERGGGCAEVLTGRASAQAMNQACIQHGVVPAPFHLWEALCDDDVLACKAARLLLYADPQPLPAIGSVEQAWNYYVRNWRPGKPHKKTWAQHYATAMEVVQ